VRAELCAPSCVLRSGTPEQRDRDRRRERKRSGREQALKHPKDDANAHDRPVIDPEIDGKLWIVNVEIAGQ
jgi:hypothetical protein